jgi:hypothetical protein
MITKIDKTKHIRPGYKIKVCLQPCTYRLKGDFSIYPGKVFKIRCTPGSKLKRNGRGGVWIDGVYEPFFIYFFEYFPIKPELVRTKKIIKSFIFTRSK